MALPKKYDFNDYDNYLTEPDYTTSAEAQDYFRNMDMLVGALVDTFLWQPETNYKNGDVVKSPSMPNGVEAVCVAENGGKSSNVEPQWGNVGGENIADGTCFWQLRMRGTVTSVNGAKPNVNGEVIVPTMQGSTSKANGASGLVPAPVAGDENKALCGDGTFKTLPIEGGGTGANNAANARKALNVNYRSFTHITEIGLTNNSSILDLMEALPTNSEVNNYCDGIEALPNVEVPEGGILRAFRSSGTAVYFEYWGLYGKRDFYVGYGSPSIGFKGWRKVLDSNNTKAYIVESYNNGTEWYKKYSDGWIDQGGVCPGSTVTFLKPFADTNYIVTMGFVTDGDGQWYVKDKKTTGFEQWYKKAGVEAVASSQPSFWRACGMGA